MDLKKRTETPPIIIWIGAISAFCFVYLWASQGFGFVFKWIAVMIGSLFIGRAILRARNKLEVDSGHYALLDFFGKCLISLAVLALLLGMALTLEPVVGSIFAPSTGSGDYSGRYSDGYE